MTIIIIAGVRLHIHKVSVNFKDHYKYQRYGTKLQTSIIPNNMMKKYVNPI